jgi:hypothetical protein
VVVDFNNDGKAEVIISIWGVAGSKDWGKFVILDYQGRLLQTVNFPQPKVPDLLPFSSI